MVSVNGYQRMQLQEFFSLMLGIKLPGDDREVDVAELEAGVMDRFGIDLEALEAVVLELVRWTVPMTGNETKVKRWVLGYQTSERHNGFVAVVYIPAE